jgi:hypothetical protein
VKSGLALTPSSDSTPRPPLPSFGANFSAKPRHPIDEQDDITDLRHTVLFLYDREIAAFKTDYNVELRRQARRGVERKLAQAIFLTFREGIGSGNIEMTGPLDWVGMGPAEKFPKASAKLNYPLYACDFDPQDPSRLVVGGGGGPGRSGVGNKIVSSPSNLPSLTLVNALPSLGGYKLTSPQTECPQLHNRPPRPCRRNRPLP